MLDEIKGFIRGAHLLSRCQRVLIAVSGGLDSMVLLEVLSRLARAPERQWSLVVAHFNHQLRGRDSQADERLVRRRAQALGWPCDVGQGHVKQLARQQGLSTEMMARQLRHQFLSKTARRRRCPVVALAHHLDDQMELFFIRLFRGTSMEGWSGMSAASPSPTDQRIRLVRPLLGHSRQAIEEYAAQEQIPYRQDASNEDESILRNRIRHQLLPRLIREYQPALRRVLARQMNVWAAESDYLRDQTHAWASDRSEPSWEELPVALQRRCLVAELIQLGLEPHFDLIEALRLHNEAPVTVAPGQVVKQDGHGRVNWVKPAQLSFKEEAIWLDLTQAGSAQFARLRVRWRRQVRRPKLLPARPGKEWFDADEVGRLIQLRHWQKGDRFQPSGLSGSSKLQDLFTNLKIPAAQRREINLATTACGQLWWVQGLRVAERFKVRPGTRRFLEWRWAVEKG